MKILFIGDVVGRGGRDAVKALLPGLAAEYGCGFRIVNAENIAGGNGLTRSCLQELSGAHVDVFTTGDHVWDQREFQGEINALPNVLRPANFPAGQPGRGYGVFEAANGEKVGVLNLAGRVFMGTPSDNPFAAAEAAVEALRRETTQIVVDFHGEATSEKIAMGRFLDGKVSAVLGTHTHVPTADEQILPGGTAFQSDVGMVGGRDSILGRDIEAVLARFVTGMPSRFAVVESGIVLHGTVVETDGEGHALSIERICRAFEPGR